MRARLIFLARFISLYCLIIARCEDNDDAHNIERACRMKRGTGGISIIRIKRTTESLSAVATVHNVLATGLAIYY